MKPSLEDSKFKLRAKGVEEGERRCSSQEIVPVIGQLINILSFAGCKISAVVLNLVQKLPQPISK